METKSHQRQNTMELIFHTSDNLYVKKVYTQASFMEGNRIDKISNLRNPPK